MEKDEYEKKAEELLKTVPPQFQEGCKKYAYQEGHSNGYSEVFIILQDIVDIIFS